MRNTRNLLKQQTTINSLPNNTNSSSFSRSVSTPNLERLDKNRQAYLLSQIYRSKQKQEQQKRQPQILNLSTLWIDKVMKNLCPLIGCCQSYKASINVANQKNKIASYKKEKLEILTSPIQAFFNLQEKKGSQNINYLSTRSNTQNIKQCHETSKDDTNFNSQSQQFYIYFMPCGHNICKICLQRSLKAKQIFQRPIACTFCPSQADSLFSLEEAEMIFIENKLVENIIGKIRTFKQNIVQKKNCIQKEIRSIYQKTVKKPSLIVAQHQRSHNIISTPKIKLQEMTIKRQFNYTGKGQCHNTYENDNKNLSPKGLSSSSSQNNKIPVICINIFCKKLTYGLFCSSKCQNIYDQLSQQNQH